MENGQPQANEIAEIDLAVKKLKAEQLTPQQQAWIDYNAVSGVITDLMSEKTDSKGNPVYMRKMPITEFAETIGVGRETLRLWRTSIPDFWGKVNKRRTEIAPQSRLQKIHESWYLKAASLSNWPVTEAWLINHDPSYKQPRMKVEHDVSESLADALGLARMRAKKVDNIQEGEILPNAPDA